MPLISTANWRDEMIGGEMIEGLKDTWLKYAALKGSGRKELVPLD